MVSKVKPKRMTIAQKKVNKEITEDLRSRGILPPVKPKLNRKKFAEETRKEFEETIGSYSDMLLLYESISWIAPMTTKYKQKISLEQIGVIKLLKIMVELKKHHEELEANGETTYKPSELYTTVILPIIKL